MSYQKEFEKKMFENAYYNRFNRPYIQPYYQYIIKTLYNKMLFGVYSVYKISDYPYVIMYKNELSVKIKEENMGLYIEVFIEGKFIFDKYIKISTTDKNANNFYVKDFLKGLSNLTKFVG